MRKSEILYANRSFNLFRKFLRFKKKKYKTMVNWIANYAKLYLKLCITGFETTLNWIQNYA